MRDGGRIPIKTWDGYLDDGELVNYTGVTLGGLGYEVMPALKFLFYVSGGSDFCIKNGDASNNTYDWLFGAGPTPVYPTFETTCWSIELPPFSPTIDGYVKVKNHLTGEYEPLPNFYFKIQKTICGTVFDVADVTTDNNGDYSVIIDYTEANLEFSFTSDQSSGDLFSFFDSTSGFNNPVVGFYDLEGPGNQDRTVNFEIYRHGTFPLPLSPDSSFDKVAHILRDAYTTDSIMSEYSFSISRIPIIQIPNAEHMYYGGQCIHWDVDSWNHQRICHEIGHHMEYVLQNNEVYPPGYEPGYEIHPVNQPTDTIFAFNEGFAEFIKAISSVPEVQRYTENNSYEDNDWWAGTDGTNTDGAIVEGAVASILLDMYDEDDIPARRLWTEDDDDVKYSSYMMPIILNCIAKQPDSVGTWSINKLAWRMMVDPGRYWFNDNDFWQLKPFICDIFEEHRFKPSQVPEGRILVKLII